MDRKSWKTSKNARIGQKTSRNAICNICRRDFLVSPENLIEEWVTLQKEGEQDKEVLLTYLCCPHCGKRYPVIMDDSETLPILQKLRECVAKRIKYTSLKKTIPQKLQDRYEKLNQKLDFKRQRLAEKFDGALYQSEGDTIQLDYRYHTR